MEGFVKAEDKEAGRLVKADDEKEEAEEKKPEVKEESVDEAAAVEEEAAERASVEGHSGSPEERDGISTAGWDATTNSLI